MKKIILTITTLLLLLIAGCSNNNNQKESGTNNSKIEADTQAIKDNIKSNDSFVTDFNEKLDQIKFNSDLTDYEEKYLKYYEEKYPTSKIYFMKTQIYRCVGCYDIYYKKDREILKIKISNYNIMQETTIKDELNLYIANPDMCKLFQGTWNTCPKLCPTDEKICVTECGAATCEFDATKLVFKKVGEVCGGLTMGDCEYGFTCSYKIQSDEYGVCVKK